MQGCSEPNIPSYLSPESPARVGFKGPVVHSNNIAPAQATLLAAAAPAPNGDEKHVLVIGGGKSEQDAASFFARNGKNVKPEVTMLFDNADAIIAAPIPLPGFIRKSRLLAIASPYVVLRTRLE
ncbi:hypothetical protein EUX98_g819 [Antrodiella citrinella]|uniref:FAD/NAD(P)-binding domain-containing protein n=1 Tax=Antrodiella citrinella TaxID=2447956 RepID=A0A4S4N4P8_9APHY|nr:hypothetical protein EUX98_g819 [Antrodiella citrinella]